MIPIASDKKATLELVSIKKTNKNGSDINEIIFILDE